MNISTSGLNLIKQFEGLRLKAYQDSVGVWTIGYGHTGMDVKPGMIITQDRADSLLFRDVQGAVNCVSTYSKPVSQNQFDALVSFAFNLGCDALRKSTLLRYINTGKLAEAADEFPKWNRASGKVLDGLTRRRSAERALFLTP